MVEWSSRLQMNFARLAFGKLLEQTSKVGQGRGVAHQGVDVHNAGFQPGDGLLEGVAEGKAADDLPVVAEDVVGAQVDLRLHGGHAKY